MPNVVFPTAIEEIDGVRYVFYGMADAHIGVARLDRVVTAGRARTAPGASACSGAAASAAICSRPWHDLPGLRVVACADPDPAQGTEPWPTGTAPKAADSLEELLAMPEVDVVALATPPASPRGRCRGCPARGQARLLREAAGR